MTQLLGADEVVICVKAAQMLIGEAALSKQQCLPKMPSGRPSRETLSVAMQSKRNYFAPFSGTLRGRLKSEGVPLCVESCCEGGAGVQAENDRRGTGRAVCDSCDAEGDFGDK